MLLIALNHCSLEDAEHLFILCSQETTYCMLQPFVGLVFFSHPNTEQWQLSRCMRIALKCVMHHK